MAVAPSRQTIVFLAVIIAQIVRAILFASATATTILGRRAIMRPRMVVGENAFAHDPSYPAHRTDDEKFANVALTHFAHGPEAGFSSR